MSEVGRLGVIHVHSEYSHDGLDSLERLREFALERGISFVALSDHAEDLEAESFATLVKRCDELSDDLVTLIPGLEYRFAGYRGLHLRALGLRTWSEPTVPDDFVAETAPLAEFTVVAHPLLARYRVPEEIRDGIDVVEVWKPRITRATCPIRARSVCCTRSAAAGRVWWVLPDSNQHDARNEREIRVLLKAPSARPLAELRAGRFVNVGRTMRFAPDVPWSRLRLEALGAFRVAYDAVERGQDQLARALRA